MREAVFIVFLITLATTLVPQATQAQTSPPVSGGDTAVVLTATAGDGEVTLNWTYGGSASGPAGWRYRFLADGVAPKNLAVPDSTPSTRSHTETSLENGLEYIFQVWAVTSDGPPVAGARSNWIRAAPMAPRSAPTLISVPDSRVTLAPGETTRDACFKLVSVKLEDMTYLETRPSPHGNVVVWRRDDDYLSNSVDGVEITAAPTGITIGRGVNLNPCVALGIGTHTVSWAWNGPDGTNPKGETSTTITVTETPPGVTVSPEALTVAEGGTGAYTVKLDTEPADTVTVTPSSSDPGAATVSGALTFTTSDWSTIRTVTVTGASDDDTSNETVILSHALTGYGAVTSAASVTVTVNDDDTTGGGSTTTASDVGGRVTVTVNDDDPTGGGSTTTASDERGIVSETMPTLQLPVDPVPVTEGTAIALTVTSDLTVPGTLPVSLTLADRASSGFTAEDIEGGLGPRTFMADFGGGTTVTVTIPTVVDTDTTEGAETYTVTLNDAAGYAVGADDRAEGTLNDGMVEDVRSSRLMRTVERALSAVAHRTMVGALDSIRTRLEAEASTCGLTLVRETVPLGVSGADTVTGLAGAAQSRSVGPDKLLRGSALQLALDAAEGGRNPGVPCWVVWGRGDLGTFTGRPAGMHYDGGLRTGWLGVDVRDGTWVAGLAMSHGRGWADHGQVGGGSAERGRLETEIVSVHPYGRWTVSEDMELRGLLGVGRGEVRHRVDGGTWETGGLSMRMVSVGLRRDLPAPDRAKLVTRADAGVARMETDGGPDHVHGLVADIWRLRAGLEASRTVALDDATTLKPFVEAAVRRDGGDGLAGAGLEVVGGLRWTAPRVRVEARGRWLAAHTEDGAEERGVGVTARVGPGVRGRGPSLALEPRWGADTGGGLALWRDGMPAVTTAGGGAALDARVGYGIAAGSRGLLTPFAETGLAGDVRRLRLGTRFGARHADMDVELAGERRRDGASGFGTAVRLDLRLRF